VNGDSARPSELPRRILIGGSRGLIGSALVPSLIAEGCEVVRLIRPLPGSGGPQPENRSRRSGQRTEDRSRHSGQQAEGRGLQSGAAPATVSWDPAAGTLDPEDLEGFDAVLHLGGESIAGGRWSTARKERLRRSRIESTALLCSRLARARHRPRVFLMASAPGFYGNRGEEELTEESPAGAGFLAGLTQAWEDAARPAREAGIRVVPTRLGMVLAAEGGALARMLPLFRLGLGGPLGGGRQIMPWISLEDVLGAMRHLLLHAEIAGPVNLTAPEAVRNREFTRLLGKALRRPASLPVPACMLRLVFGQMAEETILTSQNVRPARLQASGYAFRHPRCEEALGAALGLRGRRVD
jgi:uncharacterized protein